jgi:hypothetical protein
MVVRVDVAGSLEGRSGELRPHAVHHVGDRVDPDDVRQRVDVVAVRYPRLLDELEALVPVGFVPHGEVGVHGLVDRGGDRGLRGGHGTDRAPAGAHRRLPVG